VKIVPERFDRVLKPGETITTQFSIFSSLEVGSGVSAGTLEASIVGGGSIIRLGELKSYTSKHEALTEEEIEQLPPHEQDDLEVTTKAIVNTPFAGVGPGDFSEKSLSLPTPQGGGVNGELVFVAPENPPSSFSAKLVIGGSTVPINLMFGAFQIEFPSPIVAHRGQEVGVPVRVTLPAGVPSAQIQFDLRGGDSGLDMPPQVVSVPSGGSTSATLRLRAASNAPLGTFTVDELFWSGLAPFAMESGSIPLRITVESFSQKSVASKQIQAAAAVLSQGPPGPRIPLADTEDAGNGGFVQRYSTGNLYWHPQTGAGARWVSGAILQKYLALGGPSSLGYPITDQRPTSDGRGRFNHFQAVQLPDKPESSIYWSPQTEAHAVIGAIRRKWAELGFERSFLGYPLREEVDYPPDLPPPEGGRMVPFEGGAIYWWPDTGEAIELGDVVVNYTGLHCFGETDADQPGGLGQGADEPYVFVVPVPLSFVPAIKEAGFTPPALRSQIYEDVDAGESRPDLVEIYRGKLDGLALTVFVIEHDAGNPDTYKGLVQTAVTKAATHIAPFLTFIPVVGPVLSVVAPLVIEVFGPALGAELNSLFDLGDEVIGRIHGGRRVLVFSPKEMVLLAARTPKSTFNNIGFKRETELFSGEGASYKVYFSVDRA
jgi:hypothetical protein